MFNISIYLDKFKKVDLKNTSLKDGIISSISKVLKTKINEESVTVRGGIIYLKINPVMKNEIFINKRNIIEDLVANNIPVADIF